MAIACLDVWRQVAQDGKIDASPTSRIRERTLSVSESFVETQSQLRDSLARRIKELRLASQMSQRNLAERAGIRQALVSQIELGEANVTLDSLLKIAIALKVDFAGLFEADGEMPPPGSPRRPCHSP